MLGTLKSANTCAVVVAAGLASFVLPSSAEAKVLYRFQGGSDGAQPEASLIRDHAGNLYGTTVSGGAGNFGVVFKLAPDGTETTLHSFGGGTDGANPEAGLLSDRTGALYGTTERGGGTGCVQQRGCGTVFRLAPDGTETVLYRFQGADGAFPDAALVADNAGNLYGTTIVGGITNSHCSLGCGTVFKLAPDGTETVLYAFKGKSDGAYPHASLLSDRSGNLYGTTEEGGDKDCGFNHEYECGTVFKLTPDGKETVVHAFKVYLGDGYDPRSNLIADSEGNLYGTTAGGGDFTYKAGTVFKIAADGTESVLHAFKISDGYTPLGGLIRDAAGNLYGTTLSGGARAEGVLFKLAPDGTETLLQEFKGNIANPRAGLIADKRGRLYGTSANGHRYGSIFELHE